ncbi:MAG: hypothetical protein BWY29_00886 [Microgenomates group bacterium ADurb.Bin238]|nr:MAG: hypothetical protein BWY29_00886 [Microgenomates group bacterium ADurb.Bin238]
MNTYYQDDPNPPVMKPSKYTAKRVNTKNNLPHNYFKAYIAES